MYGRDKVIEREVKRERWKHRDSEIEITCTNKMRLEDFQIFESDKAS